MFVKKDVRSLLAKQSVWKNHIPLSNEINQSHYDVTKPTEQHQFDLLFASKNVVKYDQ